MEEIIKRFIEEQQMIQKGDTIIIGVSGGADSVALLFVMLGLREYYDLNLRVVHVNHGLREEATKEADYVRQLCETNNLPFTLVAENVEARAAKMGVGTEEAGRYIRYRAFEEERAPFGDKAKIAVAHNMNDKAETMLFHLFRGTGPKGMTSIKPVRGSIIRPLLCVTRKEIENYLNDRGIKFYIDRTNLEDTYTRNRIRNQLLPLICRNINTSAVEHIASAAVLVQEMNGYVENQTQKALEICLGKQTDKEVILNVPALLEQDPYIRKCMIRLVIDHLVPHNQNITQGHIEDCLSLCAKDGEKHIQLPYQIEVTKFYQKLKLSTLKETKENLGGEKYAVGSDLLLPGYGKLTTYREKRGNTDYNEEKKYTKCFDYGKIKESLFVRHREPGDYLVVNSAGGKKKLKDYFIDEKIPIAERKQIWVIADGSHILWIIGHRISEYYKVTQDTKEIFFVEITKEDV